MSDESQDLQANTLGGNKDSARNENITSTADTFEENVEIKLAEQETSTTTFNTSLNNAENSLKEREEIKDEISKDTPNEDTYVETEAYSPLNETPPVLDKYIEHQLKQYLIDKKIKISSLEASPGSEKGDNYFGSIVKVHVRGVDANGQNATFNWIIKIAPILDVYRSFAKVDLVYAREISAYDTVLATYEEFQSEKAVVNPFKDYPIFIKSNMEIMKEYLLFEDMKCLGYEMHVDRKVPLDYNHVKLVMKAYGKLHGLSYALKDQKPDIFQKMADNAKDIVSQMAAKEEMYKVQKMFIDKSLETLDPVKDAKIYEKFKRFTDNFMDLYLESQEVTNQYSVIGHGDSWVNNMLFKYEDPKNLKKPTHVCLLDWQLMRYASPACDLSYFIFVCTDKDFRDKYYDKMIKLYYYTLCSHVNELGSDPEKCLPFDALLAELKRRSVVGLFWSLYVLYVITKSTEEIPDIADNTDADKMQEQWLSESKNSEVYKERARGIIYNFCEYGYLDFLQ